MLSDLKQMQAKNLTIHLGSHQSPIYEGLRLQEAMPTMVNHACIQRGNQEKEGDDIHGV